ncbi:hypothetical protein [Isachenkonia alkalipeptolytica]|uniref:Tetratricopeptide repeat protein n=1 Tax=Isachenkonia alkalipeptolytica TaxID=2565777 RepID=A0AA44BC01_9CLOT|nr:hypothetical protein [Isachenkonia alkalipeptolytica]NBG86894.1 hypothetical protein [Isachenkonia alkalipeptolytica]
MVKEFREDHLVNVLIKNDEKRVKNLMTRAYLELEDREYSKAEELTEKALELEPKLAEAYILKLLVGLQVSDARAMVASADRPLTEYKDYNRALRFARGEDREKILGYNREVLEGFEAEKNEKIYQRAKAAMNRALTVEDYEAAAVKFESIPDYKDALECSEEARRLGEAQKQQTVYLEATEKMERAKEQEKAREMDKKEAASLLQEAGLQFQSIEGYQDAKERKQACEEEALGLKQEETYQRALNKKQEACREEEYQEAAQLFRSIAEYKNSETLGKECEEQGKKVGAQYLESLLRKRKRKKMLKKAVVTTAVVVIILAVILGGMTNFTYSLDEYHNLQQGQGDYIWQEAFQQIKNWFAYASNIF